MPSLPRQVIERGIKARLCLTAGGSSVRSSDSECNAHSYFLFQFFISTSKGYPKVVSYLPALVSKGISPQWREPKSPPAIELLAIWK